MTSDRYERIYDVVRRIPRGRVATYGMVAMVAGYPRAARFAGLAMHHCDDPSVPCHRVVPSGGKLGRYSAPGGVRTKLRLLEMEGCGYTSLQNGNARLSAR